MLIQFQNITKTFSQFPILSDAVMQIDKGDKIGLVGYNGSGKSTVLKLITGDEMPQFGCVSRAKNLKIAYVGQETSDVALPLKDYLIDSFDEIKLLSNQLKTLEIKMSVEPDQIDKIFRQYAQVQATYEAIGGYTLENRLATLLKQIGLADFAETPFNQLSGGQKKLAEVAKMTILSADLLLFDEPTNHLDLHNILWLEEFLKHTKTAFIVISHDRTFLDHVTNKTYEIEDGKIQQFSGAYSTYKQLKLEQLVKLQKDYDLQQAEIGRLKRQIHQFRQWAQEGDNEAFYRKAKELEKRLAKIQQIPRPIIKRQTMKQQFSESEKSGKLILQDEKIGKSYEDKRLFGNSSFTIYRGERLAVIGKNGAGKSTFIKALLGEIELDEGRMTLGANVKIGYLPQDIQFENPAQRLLAYMTSKTGNEEVARRILAKFAFPASEVTKRLKDLSGGEKVRLAMAELLQQEVNVLILDEPTNHLDIGAKEEVEGIIDTYQGTLLVVTHDRYFLAQGFDQYLKFEHQKIVKVAELTGEKADV
jgi:ATPase subunit of ABC transporter with duplicated ATPase domains